MGEHSGANPAPAAGEAGERASGKVQWVRFLPLAALTLLAAAVLAWLLDVVYQAGHYMEIAAPLIAAMPVAGLGWYATGKGRCRSGRIAAALGLTAGSVLYIGSYYAGLHRVLPAGSGLRLDRLPQYIAARMRTDVRVHRSGNDYSERKPPEGVEQPEPTTRFGAFGRFLDQCLNCLCFLLELGAVMLFTVCLPVAQSSRASRETCGR